MCVCVRAHACLLWQAFCLPLQLTVAPVMTPVSCGLRMATVASVSF